MADFLRVSVSRAKHSRNHRPDGHFNWVVTDGADGQQLVFLSFDLAIAAADRLARTGSINPTGLVGCMRGDF